MFNCIALTFKHYQVLVRCRDMLLCATCLSYLCLLSIMPFSDLLFLMTLQYNVRTQLRPTITLRGWSITISDKSNIVDSQNFKHVVQLSQRNHTAWWLSFGWMVGDGVGQTKLCTKRCWCQKTKSIDLLHDKSTFLYEKWPLCIFELLGS